MKLSKQEAQRIAREYNLGSLKSFKPFSGGGVNYNYDLKTNKGKFVIRVLGTKITKDTKLRLATEFKVLFYLHKNSFPYKVPYPLRNKKGNCITQINKVIFWVYPKIEGVHIAHYSRENIRSITRALAIYHEQVKNIKIMKNWKLYSPKELSKKYKLMKKEEPNTPRKKLMLSNLDLFEDSLNRIKNINFNINLLPIHYDFHKGNLLFKDNKLTGILDFERMLYAPRILDLAQLIKCTYKPGEKRFMERVSFILKEYNKVNPLTHKEKELILLMLAKDNCRMFERFYVLSGKSDIKSSEAEELSCLKWTIHVQKNVARELGWTK